jgi:hypothetical protein
MAHFTKVTCAVAVAAALPLCNSVAMAKAPQPREGCRVVSKLEYDSAKQKRISSDQPEWRLYPDGAAMEARLLALSAIVRYPTTCKS